SVTPSEIVEEVQRAIHEYEKAYVTLSVKEESGNVSKIDKKWFEEIIGQSSQYVWKGLYVYIENVSIQDSTLSELIDTLTCLYNIMDKTMNMYHGLTFDSRIILLPTSLKNEQIPTITNTAISSNNNNNNNNGEKIKKSELLPCLNARITTSKTTTTTTMTITTDIERSDDTTTSKPMLEQFNEVVFGGTFDHLHSGHKVMLTIGALLAKKTLFIGLTDDDMLKKKDLLHMVLPFQARKQELLSFIKLINPHIRVEVIPKLNITIRTYTFFFFFFFFFF
ncbi:bifunctional coenzyme A synthase, partial [Reticulomyxa filosa]